MTSHLDELVDDPADRLDPGSLKRHTPNEPLGLVGLPTAEWLDQAQPLVERAIHTLVEEFVDHPYLHRVEHSLHVRLFTLLARNALFNEHLTIGTTELVTQPIHKEWPETFPRPSKRGRRGNFDLAILSKAQVAEASVEQFRDGRIAAGVVIELGLDYQLKHLRQDYEKLINSEVPARYLIDLSRSPKEKPAVKEWILRVPHTEVTNWILEAPRIRRPTGIAYHHHSTPRATGHGRAAPAAPPLKQPRPQALYKMIGG